MIVKDSVERKTPVFPRPQLFQQHLSVSFARGDLAALTTMPPPRKSTCTWACEHFSFGLMTLRLKRDMVQQSLLSVSRRH